jgi:hypothetical protein
MEEPIKVNLLNDETPSIQEREETVLENAGVKVNDDGVFKVDLRNKQEDAVQEQSTDEVPVRDESETSQEVGEEVRSTEEPTEEKEVVELIKEEQDAELQKQEQEVNGQKVNEEKLVQEKQEVNKPEVELPVGVEKLINFMKETGGSMEDYVRLNTDYSSINEESLLKEYYKQTKSHLDNDEIDFLIEDNFTYDEDLDSERDIKRKKLVYKEEVAKARNFLDGLKTKYYDEIKMRSNASPDQLEAIDFYNKYKQEQERMTVQQQKAAEQFAKQTDNVFNQDFKGFEFKVGENKYRYNVKDVQSVKQAQSDILNTFKTFLGEDNMLKDASGYHKALFAARNADQIANHFYQQGQADAIKKLEAESKNINMDPRKSNSGVVDAGGTKVRVVSGENTSGLKIKLKNY